MCPACGLGLLLWCREDELPERCRKNERSVASLGNAPTEAVDRLRGMLDDDQPLTRPAPVAGAEAEPGEIVRSHA